MKTLVKGRVHGAALTTKFSSSFVFLIKSRRSTRYSIQGTVLTKNAAPVLDHLPVVLYEYEYGCTGRKS